MSKPHLRIVHEQPRVHWHGCDCAECWPQAVPTSDRLTANHLGILATGGAAVGSAIAFAIDHVGAWAAIAACLGILS